MKIKNILKTGVLIGLVGLGAGCGLRDDRDEAKIFTTEEGVKLIRTYERDQDDHIYVQSPEDSTKFVEITKYFQSIKKDKYDQSIEDAKIKKLVKW